MLVLYEKGYINLYPFFVWYIQILSLYLSYQNLKCIMMDAKKLLKKHLDKNIPKGEYRSEKQLEQLRYDSAIDAINEALIISTKSDEQ